MVEDIIKLFEQNTVYLGGAMFSIGEKVVHSPEGVCVIEDIVVMDINNERKDYYKIQSIQDEHIVVYVSVADKKHSLRKLKSKEEIEILLDTEPEEKIFLKQNVQKRAHIQKQAILAGDFEKIIKLIKLYSRKKEQDYIAIGDYIWLKKAERFVLSEVTEVMGNEYIAMIG